MQRLDSQEMKERGTHDFPLAYYHVDWRHPRYQMALHWHLEFEIIRVISGSFTLHLERDVFTLGAGDMALIDSAMLHGGTAEDAVYECIVFSSELLRHRNYADDYFIRKLVHHKILLKPVLRTEDYVDDEFMSCAIDGLFSQSSKLRQCAALKVFFSFYEINGLYRENDFAINNGKQRSDQIKKVLEYIEENCDRQLDLDCLSSIAGLSRGYFCSLFRQYTGRSCFDYINFVKMERAAVALSAGDLNVSEIAYSLGFEDASYFTRLFRRYMGFSPMAYRRKHSGKV